MTCEHGTARIGFAELCDQFPYHVLTLKQYLQQLCDDGLIVWRETSDPRDRAAPHEFELVGWAIK